MKLEAMEDNMADKQIGTPAVAYWLDGGDGSLLQLFFSLLFRKPVAAQGPESSLELKCYWFCQHLNVKY